MYRSALSLRYKVSGNVWGVGRSYVCVWGGGGGEDKGSDFSPVGGMHKIGDGA